MKHLKQSKNLYNKTIQILEKNGLDYFEEYIFTRLYNKEYKYNEDLFDELIYDRSIEHLYKDYKNNKWFQNKNSTELKQYHYLIVNYFLSFYPKNEINDLKQYFWKYIIQERKEFDSIREELTLEIENLKDDIEKFNTLITKIKNIWK